ncbi:MAG: ACT domain-containing protein [Aliishimia sp.]
MVRQPDTTAAPPPKPAPVKETGAMIAAMSPLLTDGVYVFATLGADEPPQALTQAALAQFVEAEGVSLVLPLEVAQRHGFDVSLPMCCITLQVHSALDGVGLTAAVATALAQADIPCNMVAAFHHDHAFVPQRVAKDALAILKAL